MPFVISITANHVAADRALNFIFGFPSMHFHVLSQISSLRENFRANFTNGLVTALMSISNMMFEAQLVDEGAFTSFSRTGKSFTGISGEMCEYEVMSEDSLRDIRLCAEITMLE
jgi:hypothetical protein